MLPLRKPFFIILALLCLTFSGCLYQTAPSGNSGSSGGGQVSGTTLTSSQNTAGNISGTTASSGGDHYSTVQAVGAALSTSTQTSENGHYQNR